MDKVCRLCCSTNFVSNDIFDEETALYLKMSLYLPVKIFKNDKLPQKICDKCSCKVNDFYQFCNEAIEVQNRLRDALLVANHHLAPEEFVDLTDGKESIPSPHLPPMPMLQPAPKLTSEQNTQTDDLVPMCGSEEKIQVKIEDLPAPIKHEIETSPDLKNEEYSDDDDKNFQESMLDNDFEDSDEDKPLFELKMKKKRGRPVSNGKIPKLKKDPSELETLLNNLPNIVVKKDKLPNNIVVKKEPKTRKRRLVDDNVTYNCCMCMVDCYGRKEMLLHYEAHAKSLTVNIPDNIEVPPMPKEGLLRCLRCEKTLAPEQWAMHWRGHWARDVVPFRCAKCDRTFLDANKILAHGLSHKEDEEPRNPEAPEDKIYLCDCCPLRFAYMKALMSHGTLEHPGSVTRALVLRCGLCPREFNHVNSLRRHTRSHQGLKLHLCNVCGKALSSNEHLKLHLRIHTGYKPHTCRTCDKSFAKQSNLRLHERVHTGEKPYVCPQCGKCFSQRSTLVIHERYHSGVRPYVCKLCGRGFVAQGLLSMHAKTTCI